MLSYEMFKEYTKKELIARMPPEFTRHRLEENEVYKVNRKLDAFRVMPPDTETGIMVIPVFSYQDFYPLIQKGETPDRVLELIARAASESMVPPEFALSEEQSIPAIRKEDLVLQIINYEKNREYLKDKPYRRFLDLAIICCSVVNTADKQIYAAVINHEVMKMLALSEEEMFQAARSQMETRMPCRLLQVYQQLYAYTNKEFYLGAVSLLEKEGFRTLAQQFWDDLYVLPASIHEVMLLPSKLLSLRSAQDLLRKANQEATKPEEWLSDQVYLYQRGSDEITLAELEN